MLLKTRLRPGFLLSLGPTIANFLNNPAIGKTAYKRTKSKAVTPLENGAQKLSSESLVHAAL